MHILLTDLLTCPRCGPEHGLILLAEEVRDRRVLHGVLGCANCREKYPVRSGRVVFGEDFADDAGAVPAGEEGESAAIRLAALMGVTHGPGFLLVAGPGGAHARQMAALIEDIEIVTLGPGDTAEVGPGVNRVTARHGQRMPFANDKFGGIALTGLSASLLLEEAVRVLSPVGRLVLEPAPPDAADRLAALKLRIMAEAGATIVAARY